MTTFPKFWDSYNRYVLSGDESDLPKMTLPELWALHRKEEEILVHAALSVSRWRLSTAARHFGCTVSTLQRIIGRHPQLAEQRQQILKERAQRAPDKERLPTKKRTHRLVHRAIRSGQLAKKKHCEQCGAPARHAHHDDYAAPLSVRWLCSPCHNTWHTINGEGANA